MSPTEGHAISITVNLNFSQKIVKYFFKFIPLLFIEAILSNQTSTTRGHLRQNRPVQCSYGVLSFCEISKPYKRQPCIASSSIWSYPSLFQTRWFPQSKSLKSSSAYDGSIGIYARFPQLCKKIFLTNYTSLYMKVDINFPKIFGNFRKFPKI